MSIPETLRFASRHFVIKFKEPISDFFFKKMNGDLNFLGNVFKTEKLSYKSFQKNYGKSVGMRTPGKFLEKLNRKAERVGGLVQEFSTYKTIPKILCFAVRHL